ALYDAIDNARNADILFVAAAGNSGVNTDIEPHYPASFNLPNIIAVAATDQNDRRASFSNFGTNTVHVGAPGVYILSTFPNNRYQEMEFNLGTSMATAHVSGIAGLLSAYYTNFNYHQIRQTIFRYVDIKDPSYGLNGWVMTGGRVNAYRALSSLLIPTGLNASAKSSTEITLSWSDNATGEDGYRIERKVPGGIYATIATLGPDATSYTDTGLNPSSTYYYRVIAFNNIGESPSYSNEASATTPVTDQKSGGGGCSIVVTGNPQEGVDIAFIMLLAVVIIIVMMERRR
ncbi:MAG: S8 family serine peptidase, partial [Thermodesulfovibrionales bacterium]